MAKKRQYKYFDFDKLENHRKGRVYNVSGNASSYSQNSAFQILRFSKLKGASVALSLKHTFREQETPNADLDKTKENTVLVGGDNYQDVLKAYKDRLPEKHRSDAVTCIEYLVTASHNGFVNKEGWDLYFKESLEYLKMVHGSENIVSAVIHRDETTPHMVVYAIPNDPTKEQKYLNANHFFGSPAQIVKLQDSFFDHVGDRFHLKRGEQRSKAKHTDIRKYYGDLERKVESSKEFRYTVKDIEGKTQDQIVEFLNRETSALRAQHEKAFNENKEFKEKLKEEQSDLTGFMKSHFQNYKETFSLVARAVMNDLKKEGRLYNDFRALLEAKDNFLLESNALNRLADDLKKQFPFLREAGTSESQTVHKEVPQKEPEREKPTQFHWADKKPDKDMER